MPTQEAFEAAAAELEREARMVGTIPAGLLRRFGPHVLRGGSLTRTIERVVDQAVDEHAAQRQRLEELAAICRHRAAACATARMEHERYELARARFEQDVLRWNGRSRAHRAGHGGPPGPPPRVPQAPPTPPPWVDL